MKLSSSPRAAALRDQILAVLRDEGVSSGRDIAEALGERLEIVREAPPYHAVWHRPANLYGAKCCPGCTDPTHVITRSWPYQSSDIRPHLIHLAKLGLVERIVVPEMRTHYWRTT